ncbi:hypothetical protein [Arthrobacter sp. ok909]|uniref:hypothetical protein n=1 Tax=Arthrobacter sp. ok909 TaxID=1761746 RepID=UPI001114009C|nr:hypothetical protein [Arthrobacter sp. ok909]
MHFLSNPALAGLTDDFRDMGVIVGTAAESGAKATLLVDHEYAVTALTAVRSLEGHISLSALAVRWIRAGWPEEWGADLDPSWVQVYPAGGGL